jgi:23S rRNA (guanosine2251-2'-O)-methyltransferase
MDKNDYIFGIRAVIEAIEAGRSIDKVLVRRDLTGDLARELFAKVREYDIVMQRVPQEKLNEEPSGSNSVAFAGGISETRTSCSVVL